ncbi:transaldolase family protein [Streptomyces cirratus]
MSWESPRIHDLRFGPVEGGPLQRAVAAPGRGGSSVDDAVFALTTDDVRQACDVLHPVYERSAGIDGRVSIEVDPRLAQDAGSTAAMARKLWETVDRPNLFIKIPATRAGLEAITAVTAEGISVNVTLIFSLDRYHDVMHAYLRGWSRLRPRDTTWRHPLGGLLLRFPRRRRGRPPPRRHRHRGGPGTQGTTAIANARLAFQAYEQLLVDPRWQRLAAAGARTQRPLWASTGVKDPNLPDTMYVRELVIAGTVNTMPGGTLAAFADHGTLPAHAPTRGRLHGSQGPLSPRWHGSASTSPTSPTHWSARG